MMIRYKYSGSKQQFERKLQGARASGLIESVKPAKRVVQCGLSCAEPVYRQWVVGAALPLGIDRPEVRGIEEIESFSAELEGQTVMNRELAPNGKIRLKSTETMGEVARRISLRVESWSRRWNIEGIVVDDP